MLKKNSHYEQESQIESNVFYTKVSTIFLDLFMDHSRIALLNVVREGIGLEYLLFKISCTCSCSITVFQL